MADTPDPFVCPLCQRVSHHPRDKAERFCAECGFVDDVIAFAGRVPAADAALARARAAYVDPTCPERACDHCGKPYRGPAVYCCLDCALADA